MKRPEWTFISNHGIVLSYVAMHPMATIQKIAQEAGLSIRAVQNIITDLEKASYVEKHKEGRCNYYSVYTELPLRHRLLKKYSVRDILMAIGYKPKSHRQSV
jgi:predicted transcriptional regulator